MKEIRRLYSNAGIQTEYKRKLDVLIDSMYASVFLWLQQGKTANEIARLMKKNTKEWQKVFGKQAKRIANWFTQNVKRYITTGMSNAFLEQGYFIKPRISKQKEEAVYLENVELIESIPDKFFAGLAILLLMAVQYGDDYDLTSEIKKRYDITKRRARTIADDQNHKASMIFKLSICEELGITKGRWKYTWRSKEPRLSHIKSDGKLFDLDKGLKIDGKYWYPAEDYNCKCDFVPVITEFNE